MGLAIGEPRATFKSRRELSHRKLPDGMLTAVNWSHGPKRQRGEVGSSEAGIDSVAEAVTVRERLPEV